MYNNKIKRESNCAQMKKKLRELKKLEIKIRFDGKAPVNTDKLIWSRYFSTKDQKDPKVKYSMEYLDNLDKQKLKEVISEYFYSIYFQYYKENGICEKNIFDPELLYIFGLSGSSGIEEIKKKFRELSKKYHPDLGGDNEAFIQMLDTYHKLIERK